MGCFLLFCTPVFNVLRTFLCQGITFWLQHAYFSIFVLKKPWLKLNFYGGKDFFG